MPLTQRENFAERQPNAVAIKGIIKGKPTDTPPPGAPAGCLLPLARPLPLSWDTAILARDVTKTDVLFVIGPSKYEASARSVDDSGPSNQKEAPYGWQTKQRP